MAIITDPVVLHRGVEIFFTPGTKKIRLKIAGTLSTDGVTGNCVYTKAEQLWISEPDLSPLLFCLVAVTSTSLELVNGWDWEDNTTRYLLRNTGCSVKDVDGVTSLEEWAGIVTNGSIGALHQAYFFQNAAIGCINFQLPGPVNQMVKTYGDVTHGNFDYRASFLVRCREWGYTYGEASLVTIAVATMTYEVYNFPLENAIDPKIAHTEAWVNGAHDPYQGMHLTWYVAAQVRDLSGFNYNYHVIFNGNNGTKEEVYEWSRAQLRKAGDIDEGGGTRLGKETVQLMDFIGSDLYTTHGTDVDGTFIDNHLVSERNYLYFADATGAYRQFLYISLLTLGFNTELVGDVAARYWVYFTTLPGGQDYGTEDAIIVQDADGNDMAGLVSGLAGIQLTFDYEVNAQGGRAPGTPAAVTVVAIGLTGAVLVVSTGTILRSATNVLALASALEENFVDPGLPPWSMTFDGPTQLMVMSAGMTALDVVNLYSCWKAWVQMSDNSKYLPALTGRGGYGTVPGNTAPPYFYALNGWRARPDEANHTLAVDGIFITDLGGDPWVDTLGPFNVRIPSTVPIRGERVSADIASMALAVWQRVINSGYTAEEVLRVLVAVAAGKDTIVDLGGGLATITFKDLSGAIDRVVASMDGSERTAVTLDVSGP